MEDIYARLTEVFRDVFDDETIVINENTTSNDIEKWNSFEHINLIMSVEEEFGIKIPMKKVSTMKNVGEMVQLISELIKC